MTSVKKSASPTSMASKSSSPSGIKNESTENSDIFWQSSASALSGTLVNGSSSTVTHQAVDGRLQTPVNDAPVLTTSPVLQNGSEAGKSAATSLADLKKHRAKQRQERLYRRRGSVDSNDTLTSPVVGVVSQNGGAVRSASIQSFGEQTNDNRPRRKHSNRYDLVMPEKKNDACCVLM